MKNNGEDKYSSYEQELFTERKSLESRISQGVELLEWGKIKSLEELAKLLVDKRPLNVIFQDLQRAKMDEWGEDKEHEWDKFVVLCYLELGEGIENCNARGKEFEDCNEEQCSLTQQEAQDLLVVEAIHISNEFVANMEIFGSPICDEDLSVF